MCVNKSLFCLKFVSVVEVMPEDKDSSMNNTLPVPLPKSPREVVSSDDSDEGN
jgi:hypothetical protein